MNLTEYNAMPDVNLKLAVRLAVTMGWTRLFILNGLRGEFLNVFDEEIYRNFTFNPFTDASIPYGLIGYGLVEEIGYEDELCYAEVFVRSEDRTEQGLVKRVEEVSESKTHAILNAYCAADPLGHWATFLEG